MKLSGKQVRYLRGLGHHLDPVIMLGKGGLSEAIVDKTSEALDTHELIKVKVQDGCDLRCWGAPSCFIANPKRASSPCPDSYPLVRFEQPLVFVESVAVGHPGNIITYNPLLPVLLVTPLVGIRQ